MTKASEVRPITLLIAAMGGEGGGVLTSWIVNAARKLGLTVQATSIPGVAQRTGATTYYIEIWPEVLPAGAAKPILALAPAIGEVDIVAATEFVETGRMIEVGYVTSDRTTLIASNHRVYTTHEKVSMGDGRTDLDPVLKAVAERSKHQVVFDMRAASAASGAVINAVMLGAISGAGVLPISAEIFEDGIRSEGKAVESNLRGFKAGLDAALQETKTVNKETPSGQNHSELSHRIINEFPLASHVVLEEGTTRLTDYQDVAYASFYLDRLLDFAKGNEDLLIQVARYLAVRMGYEDIFRVAQVKVRPERMARIKSEAGANNGEAIRITEYFKPRLSEISDALPVGLGRALKNFAQRRPRLAEKSWPMFVDTTSISGYFRLWVLAKLRRIRRSTLRFGPEQAEIEHWLGLVSKARDINPEVAMGIAECARLIKGYGDTHARGMRSYTAIMSQLIEPALSSNVSSNHLADQINSAIQAALADPEGKGLALALE